MIQREKHEQKMECLNSIHQRDWDIFKVKLQRPWSNKKAGDTMYQRVYFEVYMGSYFSLYFSSHM